MNSPIGPDVRLWHITVGGLSMENWINDALMAVFFLLIGLELERELYVRELSSFRDSLETPVRQRGIGCRIVLPPRPLPSRAMIRDLSQVHLSSRNEEGACSLTNLFNSQVKSHLINLGRLVEAAQLAHELKRGCSDLFVCCWGLKVKECLMFLHLITSRI